MISNASILNLRLRHKLMDAFLILLVVVMSITSAFVIHLPGKYAIIHYLFVAIVCLFIIGKIAPSLLKHTLWRENLQLRLPCEVEQDVMLQGGRLGDEVCIYFSCSTALINGTISLNAVGGKLAELQLPKRNPYWLKMKLPSIGRFYEGRIVSFFNYKIFNRRRYEPLKINLKNIGSPSEFRLIFMLSKTLNDDEQKRFVSDWTDEQHVEVSIE